MTSVDKQGRGAQARHRRTAAALFAVVAVMTGLAFAAVPLYRLFCQVTGYGGTPRIAEGGAGDVLDRVVTVRFDANTAPGLAWDFQPVQRLMHVKIGEHYLAVYQAVNRSDRRLTGTATYNVAPEIVGSYFNKVECFCFQEQILEPGQSADLPVSFFIDPAIVDDPDAGRVEEITLSYTFFPAAGSQARADTQ